MMNIAENYKKGYVSIEQMIRLVRLGILGNPLGITKEQFEQITGKQLADVISLDEIKAMQHGTVNGYRESRRLVNTVTFDNDEFEVNRTSQTNLTAMVVSAMLAKQTGQDAGMKFVYRSATNVDHEFTCDQLIALSAAMLNKVSEIYANSWEMKASIDSAKSVEEVLAVTASCDDTAKTMSNGNGSIPESEVEKIPAKEEPAPKEPVEETTAPEVLAEEPVKEVTPEVAPEQAPAKKAKKTK